MKVLVIGHTGMLGNAVCKYLNTQKDVSVVIFSKKNRWPFDSFKKSVVKFDGDYIINCIGAIPQRTNQFEVNYELPIWLDKNADCRIIHPATDCEMDDDEYGKSKAKAGRHLAMDGHNTKQIVTSIIGHEIETKFSLLDWFLNAEGQISGWSEHYWNGNTTLEWSKQAYKMMNNWERYAKRTVFSTECISKYKLLTIVKDVYDKDIIINKDDKVKADKCLKGQIETKPIIEQLKELKKFYSN
jgi:dTDP-4-dehydrorhamnose reductase|tara:strand:+ start:803 stop:1528 length:726 start_codon:yes stop_codon:yes gene_type:complete